MLILYMTPKIIIHFWFTECGQKEWFQKNAHFDETIRGRFLESYWDVANGKMAAWRNTPEGRLAEILLLDQCARNMFREQPQAFLNDPLALTLAEEAVQVGDDKKLPPLLRQFIYMPYMHSESRNVHMKALSLFEELGDPSALRYELRHKEIIDRFGRYPARNHALGRVSTPEELEYLDTHEEF